MTEIKSRWEQWEQCEQWERAFEAWEREQWERAFEAWELWTDPNRRWSKRLGLAGLVCGLIVDLTLDRILQRNDP